MITVLYVVGFIALWLLGMVFRVWLSDVIRSYYRHVCGGHPETPRNRHHLS